MKHVVSYLESGRPVLGLRTATHGFDYPEGSPFAKYGWKSKGRGRRFWTPSARGNMDQPPRPSRLAKHPWPARQRRQGASRAARHPRRRDRGTTDVYTVRLPLPENCQPLVMGQVLTGMKPTDPPAGPTEDPKTKQTVDKNNPMMPVAWVRTYTGAQGKTGRVFTTTMGSAMSGSHDWDNEGCAVLVQCNLLVRRTRR